MTVATGDTLATIAKNVYGDSALWYLIADANGLSGNSDLRVGQALSIPSRVGSGSNANTFTPYNASKVIGDTSPNLPQPAPQAQGGGGGCGGLGTTLMIVVLVVVTVYTAGALSPAAASGFSATMSAGASVMAGTSAVSGAALVGTMAIASAAGSVASQLFGMAIGAQKDFSWNQVALAALGGAVSGGMMGSTPLGPMGGAAGDAAQVIARAAISSALNQGIAVVTGLQKDFSWSNVAFAAVGAGVSHAMNGALGLNAPTGGPSGFDKFALSTMSGFASGMTMNALRGGQMTAAQVATDAFGNALGNSIAEGMRPKQTAPTGAVFNWDDADMDVGNRGNYPVATSTPVTGPGNIVGTDLPPLEPAPQLSFAEDMARRKAANNPMGLPMGGDSSPGYAKGRITGSVSATLGGDNLLIGEFRRLNPGVDVNNVRADRDYIIPTSVADREVANANFQAVAQGWKATAAAREDSYNQGEIYRMAGRELASPVGAVGAASGSSATWLAQQRADGQAYYNDAIANATNPATAVLATFGRAFNNAGYDLADGVVGLYSLATDSNVRGRAMDAIGNAISHPIDTSVAAYNAGANYLDKTSGAQMAEDALRFGAGGFATAGTGKLATAVGGVGMDAASATGRWLAPKAAELAENYMQRTGMMLNAVPEGMAVNTIVENGVSYARPSGYRVGVRDQVWESASKSSPDGLVRDPLTSRIMEKSEPWDMGHLSGHEFRRIAADAEAAGLTRKQFLDIHNDPKIYRPELPSSNRSHALEDMSDLF